MGNHLAKTEAVGVQTIPSPDGPMTAKQMFNNGYATGLIVEKVEQNTISLKRGDTVSIPVTIEYLSNTGGKEVTLTNFHNMFRNFAPSARNGLTDDQFENLVQNNRTIKGELPVDSYVKVTPGVVNLSPNSTATVTLTVSIPNDIPNEMLGKSITLGFGYDMAPLTPEIRGQTASITILVVS